MENLIILWVGDVYGKVGRTTLISEITRLQKTKKYDLIIANVENATHGKAINDKHLRQLERAGVEIFTHGNHLPNFYNTQLNLNNNVLIPANLTPFPHGWKGSISLMRKSLKIQITNLLGQNFIKNSTNNPFKELAEVIKKEQSDIHLVDFHAESSAEKSALAWAFDGKITALAGTHTHVQTNDPRFLPKKTFFLTDIGMTGPQDSIIGADPKGIIAKSFGHLGYIRPAVSHGQFSALELEISPKTKKVVFFKLIFSTNNLKE